MKGLFATLAVLAFCFYYYGANFLAFILVLSFLIFFHELGHFLVAKFFKVRILTFSIGFGKPLLVYRYKGTDYQISSIFLGGYVKMKGQDDANPDAKNYDADSYTVLHPLKRIAILFAGPFFNIVLAFFIYIFLGFYGTSEYAAQIGAKSPQASPALMLSDEILEINGKKITTFKEISKSLKYGNNEILVKRNGEIKKIFAETYLGDALNDFGQVIQKPLLGIAPSSKLVTIYHNGFSSISYAFNECVNNSTLIVKGLIKLITAELSPQNISGVITIAEITTKAAQIGLDTLLIITALLSINLGILNLLPIPVLDGGHIVFNIYEIIFKKEPSQQVFTILSYIGMALLFALMLFATYNDINRIISQ